MLVLENLSKKFKQNMILDHVNYSFKEGNIYLIRGKNPNCKQKLEIRG